MKSIFSIFRQSDNSFDGEEGGERVILLIRRHPFFVLMKLVFFLLLILIPIAMGEAFYSYLYTNGFFAIFLFVYSAWCLFLWAGIFYALTMYTLDIWIVTDRRIIDSTQHGFFNRTISELHMIRIQDVSVQTEGVIQTFLKFGDLQIQTAGAEEKFKFSQIPNPEAVKDEIMKLASVSPVHP